MTVKVGGILTMERLQLIVDRLGHELELRDARAVLVDARGILLAMGPLDWAAAVNVCRKSTFAHVPMAFVVTPGISPVGMRFSQAMAVLGGRIRTFFTDYQRAEAWALRRREHWVFPPNPHAPPPVLLHVAAPNQATPACLCERAHSVQLHRQMAARLVG